MNRLLLALILGGSISACGKVGEAGTRPGCRDGEAIACRCSDGRAGVGTCGSDACECGGVEPFHVDVGGSDPGEVPGRTDGGPPPEVGPGGVRAIPAELDFGGVYPGCERAEQELRFVNGGIEPVTITGIAGLQNPVFWLGSGPERATVQPGETVSFTAVFRPLRFGEEVDRLSIELERHPPVEVALRGLGGPPLILRDTYVVNDRPKVDFLVVIDNGVAMAPFAPRLVAELGSLPDVFLERDLDFHFAVTTTGLVAGGPGCGGGVDGGEDGRFFPVDGARPRILTRETPDLRTTWEANLAVGTCQASPPQALEAAARAVAPTLAGAADDPRHPEADDGNLGFYRQEAHLSVLVISNRADASPDTVNSYYSQLQALKGFRNTHLFNFHAIAGGDTGCVDDEGRAAESGERLRQLVEKTEGGVFVPICGNGGWLEPLVEFSGAAMGFRNCFFLGHQPEDVDGDGAITVEAGELRVLVDGVEMSPTIDGAVAWSYERDQIAVCFAPLWFPEPRSEVVIEYVASCDARESP